MSEYCDVTDSKNLRKIVKPVRVSYSRMEKEFPGSKSSLLWSPRGGVTR